jgi:biotin carboxylase
LKKLLLLGAGIEQKIIIEYAHELNFEVIAIDSNSDAPGLKISDISIIEDITNVEKICEIAQKYSVNGIMTHAVEIPHIVSRVAQKMNLPGLSPEIADIATNKKMRIECFQKNKIPSPKFVYGSSVEEILEKITNFDFPLVMKPIDNAGSRGVIKIEKIDDISKIYDECTSFSKTKTVLIEEFLSGPQISTESIIINNKIITTGFADRNYDMNKKFSPYFIENGHTIPSILSSKEKNEVIKVVENSIKAIGINFGVAKGDIIIDNGYPKVLEMAARTSGGRFASDMVPLSNGVNILKPLIQMSLGENVDMDFLKPKFSKAAVQRFFFPPIGKLKSVNGIEESMKIPGVYDIFINPNIKINDELKPITNHAERIGHVITSDDKIEKAITIAENVINKVRFEIS